VKVPLKERSTVSNALKSVHELAWDCSMGLTGRGMRGELAVDIAVQDFGCVTVPILAKVYSSSDSSASHGECLVPCFQRTSSNKQANSTPGRLLVTNVHRCLVFAAAYGVWHAVAAVLSRCMVSKPVRLTWLT
jgi:hypothetical protein